MTTEDFAKELIRTYKSFAQFESDQGREWPSQLKEHTAAAKAFMSAVIQIQLLLEKHDKQKAG